MTRPRFLADHDLNDHIVDGVIRREPAAEFVRARDVGMAQRTDADVLSYAAAHGLFEPMPGLLMVQQSKAVGAVIDSIVLIWSASEFEEWSGQIAFLPL